MKYLVKEILYSLAFIMASPVAQAADGTLNFKGEITTAGCVIENPDMLVEGFKNAYRWPVAEQRVYFSGPVASVINLDCGVLNSIPKIRFTPETGTVVGTNATYLKITGTASNVAFRLGAASKNEYLDLNGKLYDLTPIDVANGKYRFAINHYVVGLSPYDESNNGEFEAILGYDLIYN